MVEELKVKSLKTRMSGARKVKTLHRVDEMKYVTETLEKVGDWRPFFLFMKETVEQGFVIVLGYLSPREPLIRR